MGMAVKIFGPRMYSFKMDIKIENYKLFYMMLYPNKEKAFWLFRMEWWLKNEKI